LTPFFLRRGANRNVTTGDAGGTSCTSKVVVDAVDDVSDIFNYKFAGLCFFCFFSSAPPFSECFYFIYNVRFMSRMLLVLLLLLQPPRLLALLEVAVLEGEFRLLALTPAGLVVKVHIRPLYDKQDTQMRVRLDEHGEKERERGAVDDAPARSRW
jgi:hypothetical protein